jgi:hypothetical protein
MNRKHPGSTKGDAVSLLRRIFDIGFPDVSGRSFAKTEG